MKFILVSSIVAIATTNCSQKKRFVLCRVKLGKKVLCKVRMIVLDAKMAWVASIKCGSCVCLFLHQLCARNKVCPLPGHSARISHTPIPARLYYLPLPSSVAFGSSPMLKLLSQHFFDCQCTTFFQDSMWGVSFLLRPSPCSK